MNRNNRKRGRSLPKPQRQKIDQGKTQSEFKRLRGGMEQQFIQSSEQPIFNFRQHLDIKETKSQKIQLKRSQQKPSEPQHNISEKEKDYRHALEFLKKMLRLGQSSDTIQNAFNVMLECFQQYRKQEIRSIDQTKQMILSQNKFQRDQRLRQLDHQLKEEEKIFNEASSQYQQLIEQWQAARKSNSPEQQILNKKIQAKQADCKNVRQKLCSLYERLRENRKMIIQEAEKKEQIIEREFSQKLNEQPRILEEQRKIHENIKRLIEKRQIEKPSLRQRLKDKQRQRNLIKLGEAPKDLLKSFLEQYQKQETLQEQFLRRAFKIREEMRQEYINTRIVRKVLDQLMYDCQILIKNLRKTIFIQQQLIHAKEVDKANQYYEEAQQMYENAVKTSDDRMESFKSYLEISKQSCDRCKSNARHWETRLDSRDKQARRKKRFSLEQLQSALCQMEQFQDQLVDTEQRVYQLEIFYASLQGLKKRRRLIDYQRNKLVENLRQQQQQQKPSDMMVELWTNGIKSFEKELRRLDEEIREIEKAKEKPS